VPWLGSDAGWNVRFGRELNASDDRDAFVPAAATHGEGRVEGKQIEPFRVALEGCRYELSRSRSGAPFAFRASASRHTGTWQRDERLTLIAAIVPARAVTTHTLFCLKTLLSPEHQFVLCALLNSYVANYLIRLRVNTHVTATLMSRLLRSRRFPRHTPRSHGSRRSLRSLIESKVGSRPAMRYAEVQGWPRDSTALRVRVRACAVDVSVGAVGGEKEALRWFEAPIGEMTSLIQLIQLILLNSTITGTQRRGDAEVSCTSMKL